MKRRAIYFSFSSVIANLTNMTAHSTTTIPTYLTNLTKKLKNKPKSIGAEMGKSISESLRLEVWQRWMKGESRNKIASVCGISQGAVSSIIDEWKRSVGITLAEQQRELFTL